MEQTMEKKEELCALMDELAVTDLMVAFWAVWTAAFC